jgi:hypothetical protein
LIDAGITTVQQVRGAARGILRSFRLRAGRIERSASGSKIGPGRKATRDANHVG